MATAADTAADYLGLRTDRYERRGIAGQRVEWIAWDSPARGLAVGDIIVAVRCEDARLEGAELPRLSYPPAGSAALFAALGMDAGAALIVTVTRDGTAVETIVEPARLPSYQSHDGKRALFPGGPYYLSRGNFHENWHGWYERIVKTWSAILCDGWRPRGFKSRKQHEAHAAEWPRIEYLLAAHPGPFAEHAAQAWRRVERILGGRSWSPAVIDLSYREYARQRREKFKAAAKAEHERYLQTHADTLVDAFPAPDPYADRGDDVAGRLIAIDRISPRNMRNDGVEAWYILGDKRSGWYFLDVHSPEVMRLWDAIFAYQRQVTPHLAERYRFYLRVSDMPMIRTRRRREVALGFTTQLVAAMVGDELFLHNLDTPAPLLAGRELLAPTNMPPPPDDATPRALVQRRVDAAKRLREDVWRDLFADWTVSGDFAGQPIFLPYGPGHSDKRSGWEQTQRRLTSDVLDVKVVAGSKPFTVLPADPLRGTPQVEACEVEVEHVGDFDGEYRSFKDSFINRVWQLQRVDGGPWRFVSPRAL